MELYNINFKNNKILLIEILILTILLIIIFIYSPSKLNIYIFLSFLLCSLIYNYSTPDYEFILNNRYILYITTLSLLNLIIYHYNNIFKKKISLIINVILLITIFIRYIHFMYNLNTNTLFNSNSYYHKIFFFNIFGFYFWYHLFVILILISLYFMDSSTNNSNINDNNKWDKNEKILIGIFVLFITLLIDFMYFIAKPYSIFN